MTNLLRSREACPHDRSRDKKQCHVCALGMPRVLRTYADCPVQRARMLLKGQSHSMLDAYDDKTAELLKSRPPAHSFAKQIE